MNGAPLYHHLARPNLLFLSIVESQQYPALENDTDVPALRAVHKIDLLGSVRRQRRKRDDSTGDTRIVAEWLARAVKISERDVVDGCVWYAGCLADEGEARNRRRGRGTVTMQRRRRAQLFV